MHETRNQDMLGNTIPFNQNLHCTRPNRVCRTVSECACSPDANHTKSYTRERGERDAEPFFGGVCCTSSSFGESHWSFGVGRVQREHPPMSILLSRTGCMTRKVAAGIDSHPRFACHDVNLLQSTGSKLGLDAF